MKIDLHIHTKKISQGDPETREIKERSVFINALKDNNVGIAAITNHYKFDIEHYEWLKSDKDFILLPGIELDVDYKGNRRQINVIVPPNDALYLFKISKKLKNSKNNLLSFEKLLQYFDKEKFILYPDHKRHKNDSTWWNSKELLKLKESVKTGIVIADVNNASTLMVLKSHNFHALIGSDVQDWKEYYKSANKLLDTELNIENYDVFIKILNYKSSYDAQTLDNIFKNIEIKEINKFKMPETSYWIENLNIKSGVNIIFGSKRTGKTEILKNISQQLSNEEVSMYFSSHGPDINLTNIKEDLKLKTTKEFEKDISDFKIRINELINYKETKYKDFNHFFLSLEKNKSKLLFNDNWIVNKTDPSALNKINRKYFLKIIQNTKSILNNFIEIKINEKELERWTNITQKILDDLWNIYLNKYRTYWNVKLNINISNRINNISKKFNGSINKPNTIGLFKRFEEKTIFIKNLKEIQKMPKENSILLKEFELPERGKIRAKQFVNFIEFGENKQDKWIAVNKLKIKTEFSKLNSKILKLSYKSDFIKISEEIDNIIKKSFFCEEVKLLDKNNKDNFSNGEKAHLSLFNTLDKDKKYYLLDEPDVYLGSKSISQNLLDKISDLVQNKK